MGYEGEKNWNDTTLRPEIEELQSNSLTTYIQSLIQIKHEQAGLHDANYKQIAITNTACIYERNDLWICINLDENECSFSVDMDQTCTDLLTNKEIVVQHQILLDGYQAMILKK